MPKMQNTPAYLRPQPRLHQLVTQTVPRPAAPQTMPKANPLPPPARPARQPDQTVPRPAAPQTMPKANPLPPPARSQIRWLRPEPARLQAQPWPSSVPPWPSWARQPSWAPPPSWALPAHITSSGLHAAHECGQAACRLSRFCHTTLVRQHSRTQAKPPSSPRHSS